MSIYTYEIQHSTELNEIHVGRILKSPSLLYLPYDIGCPIGGSPAPPRGSSEQLKTTYASRGLPSWVVMNQEQHRFQGVPHIHPKAPEAPLGTMRRPKVAVLNLPPTRAPAAIGPPRASGKGASVVSGFHGLAGPP